MRFMKDIQKILAGQVNLHFLTLLRVRQSLRKNTSFRVLDAV